MPVSNTSTQSEAGRKWLRLSHRNIQFLPLTFWDLTKERDKLPNSFRMCCAWQDMEVNEINLKNRVRK